MNTLNNRRMKNLLFLSVLVISILSSCGAPVEYSEMEPDKLREILNGKKTEYRALEKEIREITAILESKEGNTVELTPVTVDTVRVDDFVHFVDLQATVLSQDEVIASAEIGGRINNLYVAEGQNVSKGQVLARIDNRNLLAQKAEIETQLALARDVFRRQDALWKDKIGSEIQYLEAKTHVERLERNIETIHTSLEKSVIYAPKSGVIAEVNMKEGELASPGIPIVSIVSNRDLKVVAELPESYLNSIRKGDKVTVEFPAIHQTQEAIVSLIGSVINPANRTFKIEARIQPDKNGLIKPNMFARVRINDYTLQNVKVLPLPLVQQEISGREFVISAVRSGGYYEAAKNYVKTGQSFNNRVVILEGIEAGSLVVQEGARGLVEGTKLSVITDEEADRLFNTSSDSGNTSSK